MFHGTYKGVLAWALQDTQQPVSGLQGALSRACNMQIIMTHPVLSHHMQICKQQTVCQQWQQPSVGPSGAYIT